MGVFAPADRLAIANSAMRDGISREMKRLEEEVEGGSVSPQSLSAICLLFQVFLPSSLAWTEASLRGFYV